MIITRLRVFDDLRDAEGHGSHEVVARGAVPVPDGDQQATVLVVRLQVANFEKIERERSSK